MENVKDVAIFALDLEARVTHWNPGAESVFGYAPADVLGENVDRIFTTEDQAHGIPTKERHTAVQNGYAPDERWHLRKNGERVFASGAMRPIMDEKKQLRGYLKVVRDITAYKLAQVGLERKTKRLQMLADLAQELLSSDTPEQIVRQTFSRLGPELSLDFYCNHIVPQKGQELRLDSFAGVPESRETDVLKLTFTPLVPAESRTVAASPADNSNTQFAPETLAFLQEIGIHAFVSFPLVVEETIMGTLFFASRSRESFDEEDLDYLHTVSNFVALAQARALYQRDLEGMVQHRTAELQTKIGELEAFSYSVSHDLRAPLRAMQGYSNFLIEDYADKLDESGREFLNRIAAASGRLDRLVTDILTYSRVARENIEKSTIHLEPLVQEVIQSYPALQAAEIHVRTPLIPVIGHEGSLTQCISNLLGNAIKFIPSDRKPVGKIWTELRGSRVRLNFQDNGIGISAADQERIFKIFEKASQGGFYEGTGIGLAIVRKAVERMEGRTGVESELEKGSTFWIELPQSK
jgi:PAS domain S-box-containing protein